MGEALGLLDAAGSLLCLSGVMLISKPTFVMSLVGVEAAPLPFYGTLGAIFAAFSATGTYVLLRYARHLDPIVSTNYFAMVGIALSPLFGWAFGEAWHLPLGYDWVKLFLLAVLSVAGQAFMNLGLALQTAAKATAMNYIQVVFAFAFQVTLLHEGSDALSVAGAVMIASWGGVALAKEALASRRAKAVRPEATASKV
uniref:EamA domain-containing protein n=1 Tax=Alexandrium catenella TaxID=2925 RepID=A0A7S1S5C8_ALECA